jgi:hypothetical protein
MTDELVNLVEQLRKVESSRSWSQTCTNWYRNPDGPEAADAIEALLAERARLGAALGATIGNMMNAQFDLEGGTTKAFAIKQIGKAITNARAALTACSGQPETTSGGE